ncbi:hypothetical protein [Streptomyces prunicolor]|nr:hypothetical protein [Streptomyces prunicolor]
MSDVVQVGFLVIGGATVYVCLGVVGAGAAIAGVIALVVVGIRRATRR